MTGADLLKLRLMRLKILPRLCVLNLADIGEGLGRQEVLGLKLGLGLITRSLIELPALSLAGKDQNPDDLVGELSPAGGRLDGGTILIRQHFNQRVELSGGDLGISDGDDDLVGSTVGT